MCIRDRVTPPRNGALAVAPPSLPGPAVVFGRQAGDVAVGISAAARGGRLGVQTTAIGPDGAPIPGADVAVSADGGPFADAVPCVGDGTYCASTPVERDTPSVRVRLGLPDGSEPTVGFALPSSPEHARAKRLVARAATETRTLKSVVIDEHLAASTDLALDTVFEIRAPDRMRYRSTQVEDGRRTPAGDAIVIGGTRWDRPRPNVPWTRSAQQPLDQPVADWRDAFDPSILGSTRIRGRDALRVSFRDASVPAWLEVAIDRRTGLPLRVRMTAAAHFMTRDWRAFDRPVAISPPATGATR